MVAGPSEGEIVDPGASEVDVESLAEALEPLASETRLRLLAYLTEPHYLEEIASFLEMSREGARKHVNRLLDIGAVQKKQGERETGPVVEYIVVPQVLFALSEDFAKLGALQPDDAHLTRTQVTGEVGEGEHPRGPALVLVHGLHRGRVHRLAAPGDPWRIGRGSELEVPLEYDPFVSQHHAEVSLEDGEHVLADAYSTNGTYLNWEQLDRGGQRVLQPGDVIGIGKSLLVYRA